MDTKIFTLSLTVEAISAYIIIDSLISLNIEANYDNILAKWNAAEETLLESLNILTEHKIIFFKSVDKKIYCINLSSEWC